jgi:hypothetical protein
MRPIGGRASRALRIRLYESLIRLRLNRSSRTRLRATFGLRFSSRRTAGSEMPGIPHASIRIRTGVETTWVRLAAPEPLGTILSAPSVPLSSASRFWPAATPVRYGFAFWSGESHETRKHYVWSIPTRTCPVPGDGLSRARSSPN